MDARQRLGALLADRYQVSLVGNDEALQAARAQPQPDLILLGWQDDYALCRKLCGDPQTRHIPLILVTGRSDVADEQLGFDLGAADYITKPVSPPIVLARVRAQLQLKASADFLRDRSEYLEWEVRRRTHDIQRLQEVTVGASSAEATEQVPVGEETRSR